MQNKFEEKQFNTAAVVAEFLHKLFPGRTIFAGKKNVAEILLIHHDYTAMIVGSAITQSRLIRFLNVVSIVLVSIFVDTVFFGVFYAVPSPCTSQTEQVKNKIWSIIFMCNNRHLNYFCLYEILTCSFCRLYYNLFRYHRTILQYYNDTVVNLFLLHHYFLFNRSVVCPSHLSFKTAFLSVSGMIRI